MRAVALLRERYDWKARLAVEMEEPEEFVPGNAFEPAALTGGTADEEADEDDDEADENEMAVDGNGRDVMDEDSSGDEAEMAERRP